MEKVTKCGSPEEIVINLHKVHYEWINRAIVADESQDVEEAVRCYIKGLEVANVCLKEKVIGNSHSQVRAREIQEKMKKNRESEIERLELLLGNKLQIDKNSRVLNKSPSLDIDEIDFKIPNTLTKSMRDKKVKPQDKEKMDKNSCSKNSGMGERSHSANCLNKINTNIDGNLANALKGISNANKIPANKGNIHQTGIGRNNPPNNKRPITAAGGVTRTKVSQISPPTERKVDKEAIWSKLKNVDKAAVETILNEVLDNKVIKFEDIAGNEIAKQCLLETVIYPKLRPELFTGLRSPAKGILLFGPPGNGKTLLAKAVANESGCVFYNISAASLMSKWVGEGEKMVRALFAVARFTAPSVIFLDEVDSLLSARNSDDKSVSRRMLTQFLQEIDGAATETDDKLLVMAATNRPDELDDAALRRFQKKIHIKMPEASTRKVLLLKLINKQPHILKDSEVDKIIDLTKGYSSSDLNNLAKCAAMVPIRELSYAQLCAITTDSMRPLHYNDFISALKQIKPSVPPQSLARYEKWNSQFGDNS